MTEREKQLRRSQRLRIGAILALVLIAVVPVVVVMAASPDPSSGETPAASSTATEAPATTKPDQLSPKLLVPDTLRQGGKLGDRKGGRGLGAFGGGHGAVTITAIDGSKVSLTTEDGWTRTITVTADTKIRKGGQDAKVGDLAVGDQIRFSQKRNDDGSYTITAIQVPTPKTGGEVTKIDGDTLTLKRRNGETQTVTLTGSTTYQVGREAGARTDVKVGSKVTVEGSTSGDAFTALTVHIQPDVVAGEVTAKGKDSLTLKLRDGSTVVVHVASDTKVGVRGNKAATLADIAVGDVAWAVGSKRADGSLDATGVAGGKGWGKKGDHKDDTKSPKVDGSSTNPG